MKQKNYLRLADIEAYRLSFHVSNQLWKVIISWDHFSKDTVGKQFVRAMDSISANIAEGFGRYNKKDKIKFYRIARGSVYECLDFNEKAKIRGLLTSEEYIYFFLNFGFYCQHLPGISICRAKKSRSLVRIIRYDKKHAQSLEQRKHQKTPVAVNKRKELAHFLR